MRTNIQLLRTLWGHHDKPARILHWFYQPTLSAVHGMALPKFGIKLQVHSFSCCPIIKVCMHYWTHIGQPRITFDGDGGHNNQIQNHSVSMEDYDCKWKNQPILHSRSLVALMSIQQLTGLVVVASLGLTCEELTLHVLDDAGEIDLNSDLSRLRSILCASEPILAQSSRQLDNSIVPDFA